MSKRFVWSLIAVAIACAVVGFMLRPVCDPLSDEDVRKAPVPLDQRTERTLWYKTFQKRDGRWYQCKSWVERQFFF